MERQHLIHYNTSNAASVPMSENLIHGELAVKYSKGNETIFMKNDEDEVVSFAVTNTVFENALNELREEFSASIESKADKTELDGYSLTNHTHKEFTVIDQTVSNALTTLQEAVEGELNNKADKSEIPSLDGYVTETELEAKGYLTAHQDISGLATKEELNNKADKNEIPNLSGYATENWVDNKGYLTAHQSLNHLATKEELNGKQDIISDLETIRNGAALGATAVQYNQLADELTDFSKTNHTHDQYATIQDLNRKQDVIDDLTSIRNGAALGATAVQSYSLETTLTDFVKIGDLTTITNQLTAMQAKIEELEQQIKNLQS